MQALDDEILRLQQVRHLLKGAGALTPALEKMVKQNPAKRARTMTEEGRRRIAEAQHRRWARARGL